MPINGAHALFYTAEPEALRALLRDVFGFRYVDAGGGWLIFALPPAELGVHPVEGPASDSRGRHELAFMCDDIQATIRELQAKGLTVRGEPKAESYGLTVTLDLPGGLSAMLYEPRHAAAAEQPGTASRRAFETLWNEVANGGTTNGYLLNSGDRGFVASLDAVSAAAASVRPAGRSSVAAHAEHIRYGLELLNRWARGEDPWSDANWAASWSRQDVTEDQWRALRGAVASETQAFSEAMKRPRTWDEFTATTAFGCVAHLSYHLGAIRQIAAGAEGPRAEG